MFTLVILLFLIGCFPIKPKTAPEFTVESGFQLLNDIADALEANDTKKASSYFTDSSEWLEFFELLDTQDRLAYATGFRNAVFSEEYKGVLIFSYEAKTSYDLPGESATDTVTLVRTDNGWRVSD